MFSVMPSPNDPWLPVESFTGVGPLINARATARIDEWIGDAVVKDNGGRTGTAVEEGFGERCRRRERERIGTRGCDRPEGNYTEPRLVVLSGVTR
jgi:hypothetical protein